MAKAINSSLKTIFLYLFWSTFFSADIKNGIFPNGSITRNNNNDADNIVIIPLKFLSIYHSLTGKSIQGIQHCVKQLILIKNHIGYNSY